MTAGTAERRRDWPTIVGLAVVGVVAVVWSFTALADLAHLLGITGVIDLRPVGLPVVLHVAWGLPLTVDALAAVATRVWLQGRVGPEAVRYARRAAWAAILATVGGNAYHGWLTGDGRLDAVLASAVPAVAVGVIVHLAVLIGRKPGAAGEERAGRPPLWARARGRVGAWREQRRAAAAGRVQGRATAGDAGRGPGGPPVPTAADSNDVIAADLRRLNAARRADGADPLGRDAVVKRYGIGSSRAQTVRDLADRPTAAARPHLVPPTIDDDDGEATA